MDVSRKDLNRIRNEISNRPQKQEALVERLMPFLQPFSRVGLYIPIKGEADITASAKRPLYPVMKGSDLVFGPSKIFVPAAFGVYEPVLSEEITPDCLVVPMVAFWNTNRMGYGKGFYDRYIEAHPDLFTIGVAFDEQEQEFTAREWDQPLDMIVTPSRILVNGTLYERKRKYTQLLEEL